MTELVAFYLISLTVSTFLSMFEVSILTINPIKLNKLIESKPHLVFFQNKKDKAATDIMVFNFLWDYGSAMLLSVLIAAKFADNGLLIIAASAGTALGTLYIATLAAKLFASKKSHVVLNRLGRLIIVVYWLMKPFLFLISAPVLMILRGFLGNDNEDKLSDGELLGVLAMAKRDGLLAQTQHTMIKRVVELTSQKVKDIMPKDQVIESVKIEDCILSLKDKIKSKGHKRIVVTKEHNGKAYPVGILMFRDVVRAYVGHIEDMHNGEVERGVLPTIASVMHPCVVTPEDAPAEVLIQKLSKGDHIVVAIDENGVMSGVMQSDDIVNALT